MKTINLCFRVHQRNILKRYRFFNIGSDHYYYDDFANETVINQAACDTYLEANRMMLEMIENSKRRFRVSFSITGIALELFQQYAPEVIESFQALARTGCVEFLATPYGHSLAALFDEQDFERQVRRQMEMIQELFGVKCTAFANSALLYNDDIAAVLMRIGFKTVVIEGAKHVMGWKSPHYIYSPEGFPKMKLVVRDSKLSDDINYRFSQWRWEEYPLTAEKFISWIEQSPAEEQVYNLFMGYEAIGRLNRKESGIFDFFRALPYHAFSAGIEFSTPSAIAKKTDAVAPLSVVYPMSWTDEEKDASAWISNDLQREALDKLYEVAERVRLCNDSTLDMDWYRLQDSTNFFFMTTKHYSDGMVAEKNNPYDSPYDAFMNYMNVLSDFRERVEAHYPSSIDNEELNSLLTTINNQQKVIKALEAKLAKLAPADAEKPVAKKRATTKKTVK